MSKLDDIKNKVRGGSSQGVHSSFIGESNIIQEDKKANSQQIDTSKTKSEFVTPLLPPEKREKKKKFEELYSRDTVWFKNELKQQIAEASEGERGEKTRIINEALEEYFKKRGR
ncbi:hypothetical protein [Paenibacillus alba]|uniref:CopG family transcriptional regulator n=1 Tax=Paenibacillus alba TaxID=1197127 RepID=A0ABU6GF12_9BACL|nr:hypothetical protein [Paenibacillus alba]MEC0231264.1 hypothetical protein [Paenibacillus alba]